MTQMTVKIIIDIGRTRVEDPEHISKLALEKTCAPWAPLPSTRLSHANRSAPGRVNFTAAKKAPGPLVGTLEGRHWKNDVFSVR